MSTAAANPLTTPKTHSGRERLLTTLIFAVLAHGLLLLGVGFVAFAPLHSGGSSVNVTLVNSKKAAPLQDASYLARINQRGPGNTRKHLFVRPPAASLNPFSNPGFALADRFAATVPNRAAGAIPIPAPEQRLRPDIVTTRARSLTVAPIQGRQTHGARPRLLVRFAQPAPRPGAVHTVHTQAIELPRLYGSHATAKAHSVNAVATLSAPYLIDWQQRVERIGTAQFARLVPNGIESGHLTLAVTLAADGSVSAVAILKRSHEPLLDAAALKIIRLAAPFPPFPPALAAQTKTLTFSYRWNFIRGATGSGTLGLGGR